MANVKIISYQENITKPKLDGSTYQAAELSYNKNGEVKSTSIAMAFLAHNQALRDKLQALNAGDTVDVVYQKNGNFMNLVDIKPAGSGGISTKASTTSSSSGGFDSRQESIVFQNSMAHATAIAIHNSGGAAVNVADVIAMAKGIASVALQPQISKSTTKRVEAQVTEAPAAEVSEESVVEDVPMFGD